jgi:hypothetical protein
MRSRVVEQAENELADIAIELTALSDMIPALFSNYEDMEARTPQGIKLLIEGIRKRVVSTQKLVDEIGGGQLLG